MIYMKTMSSSFIQKSKISDEGLNVYHNNNLQVVIARKIKIAILQSDFFLYIEELAKYYYNIFQCTISVIT